MKTRPLALCNLLEYPYDKTVVCAYIYYGTVERPLDQNGHTIGMFVSDQKKLFKHVNEVIANKIQKGLEGSGYRVRIVDYVNNAPQPALFISRLNNLALDENDRKNIQNKLNEIITAHNKKVPNAKFARMYNEKTTNREIKTMEDVRALRMAKSNGSNS